MDSDLCDRPAARNATLSSVVLSRGTLHRSRAVFCPNVRITRKPSPPILRLTGFSRLLLAAVFSHRAPLRSGARQKAVIWRREEFSPPNFLRKTRRPDRTSPSRPRLEPERPARSRIHGNRLSPRRERFARRKFTGWRVSTLHFISSFLHDRVP